jgi:hypothetical protein
MAEIIDLTHGKWRLHTRLGAVNSWDEMGTPAPFGTGNSDVFFTFIPAPDELADIAAQLAPIAPSVVKPPSGLKATWYRAHFEPSKELRDTEPARGEHWARVFPGAQGKDPHLLVQIVS